MLSKAQNKYIRSLAQQKFRNEYKAFAAEGEKIALEWLGSDAPVKMIVATPGWAEIHKAQIARHPEAELHIVKDRDLAALSSLQATNSVMLVLPIPLRREVPVMTGWSLALDRIQDPGNMGTIIRIADWFGIEAVVCSPGCADAYNPKVVQSAMGSHLRVSIYEAELASYLSQTSFPKYAAVLDGESIYSQASAAAGVLIIGNESKGISDEILQTVTKKVTIPRYGGAESLNAAVSAGILCALLIPH